MRFIPASAGNTPDCAAGDRPYPVHPRVCGEHGLSMTPKIHQPGSSPRLRGTHGIDVGGRHGDRFIPASTGNTLSEFFA